MDLSTISEDGKQKFTSHEIPSTILHEISNQSLCRGRYDHDPFAYTSGEQLLRRAENQECLDEENVEVERVELRV
jgi:hypothetical protein